MTRRRGIGATSTENLKAEIRAATLRELAKALNFDKGWECQQLLWEDLENAVNGSNFSTTEDDILNALREILKKDCR